MFNNLLQKLNDYFTTPQERLEEMEQVKMRHTLNDIHEVRSVLRNSFFPPKQWHVKWVDKMGVVFTNTYSDEQLAMIKERIYK